MTPQQHNDLHQRIQRIQQQNDALQQRLDKLIQAYPQLNNTATLIQQPRCPRKPPRKP